MRVVFLDVDGVLDVLEQNIEHPWTWSPVQTSSIKRLNEIVKRTGAHVVVASTWRNDFTPTQVRRKLRAKGFQGRLIGATPKLFDAKVDYPRGVEVKAWLTGADHHNWPRSVHEPVESFVILDDRNDYGDIEPFRVMPDSEKGLSARNVADAVRILGKARSGKKRVVREHAVIPALRGKLRYERLVGVENVVPS